MKKYLLMLMLVIGGLLGKAQVPFTPGNFVVYRVGDGSIDLSALAPPADFNGQPVFLDEYTPAGVKVQSIAMPTTVNGSNYILTGTRTNVEGLITLSVDGHYIVVPGYNAPVGTNAITNTSVQRVVGLVKYDGTINTSTALTDAGVNAIFTSATSSDGANLWITFNTVPALNYATVGATTSTVVNNANTGFKCVKIIDGQLYVSRGSRAIAKVGTGTPTTCCQTLSSLVASNGSTMTGNQFEFFDLNPSIPGVDVLYIADDNSGLAKYSFNGTTWTPNGVIGTPSDRYYGVTGQLVGNTVKLFATRNGSNTGQLGGGQIISIDDASGYNGTLSGTPTVIADLTQGPTSYAANTYSFRGVVLVPQAPPLLLSTKVFLQGAYNAGLGRHKDVTPTWASVLNANALTQPFNTTAFGNYAGTESVASGFFQSTAATTDVLDWVLVELHDATTPSTVISRRAAFVREDGQVVDVDGTSPVSFSGVNAGNYYVVIKHRNHLAIRSSSAVALSSTVSSYDFTTAQAQAYQDGSITANAAMKDLGGVFGMWAGNANSNTQVRYTGLNNDAGAILARLSANQAGTLSGYWAEDLNLDGTVRYTGLNNDAGVILATLSANQAAVYTQHQ